MTTYNEESQQVVADALVVETSSTDITFSTGVVVYCKPVSPFRLQAVVEKYKRPAVPSIFDEEKGRELRNPNHPDYIAELEEYEARRSMAIVDAMIVFGLGLKHKPEHLPAIEDESWIEEMELAGVTILRESIPARFLSWIKYVAFGSVEDMQKVVVAFSRGVGVSEGGVTAQMQRHFPDHTE